jgi:AraC-like DNA-binding protein
MKLNEVEKFFAARPLEFLTGFRHPAPRYCGMHFHQAMEIVYHPTGSGRTSLKSGAVVTYEEHSVVVYAPYMPHDQVPTQVGEDICLHVDSALPLPRALQSCVYVPPVRDAHLLAELQDLSRFNSGLKPLQKTALSYRVTALLIQLIQASSAVSRDAKRPNADRYAIAARDYIQSHSQEIEKIEDIAQRVGVSHDYLRHIFKQRFGMSLARCLNLARVDRSKDLLTRSTLPLKIVATMCGFENERYFSHVFKKHESRTPGDFRNGRN